MTLTSNINSTITHTATIAKMSLLYKQKVGGEVITESLRRCIL